jgi:hypothetical protein
MSSHSQDNGSKGVRAFTVRDARVRIYIYAFLEKEMLTAQTRYLNPTTWWSRLELDSRTVLMMLKGALIPTIVTAM